MPLITLTSDMGTHDHYVAVVKAAIYRQLPEALIVDISHHVRPFDVAHAALLLRASVKDFPQGTVHVIGVQPEKLAVANHLAVYHSGQYFIGADNGIFPLIFDGEAQKAVNLDHVASNVGETSFPMRDIFTMAACHIAKGGSMDVLGKPSAIRNHSTLFQPVVLENAIRGVAVHVDTYGNVITNIDRVLFDGVKRGRNFEIRFRKDRQRARKLHVNYSDVEVGEVVVLFGSSGFLEIAMNGGNASQLLGIKPADIVSVEFA